MCLSQLLTWLTTVLVKMNLKNTQFYFWLIEFTIVIFQTLRWHETVKIWHKRAKLPILDLNIWLCIDNVNNLIVGVFAFNVFYKHWKNRDGETTNIFLIVIKREIFPLVSFQNIYALPQWVTYLIPHYVAFAKQIINK